MAIKAHNASPATLTLTEIAAEWNPSRGSTATHSLDQYHSGESLVYSGARGRPGGTLTTIPVDKQTISFSNFYASERFVQSDSFTLFSASSSTFNGGTDSTTVTVPAEANAIYIINTSAGGGGGIRGSDHKDVGEDPGDGGGGGAGIESGYFTVVGGETLTLTAGRGGDNNVVFWPTEGQAYIQTSNSANIDGGNTSIVGSSSGQLFSLGGGAGAVATRVGEFKLLRLDSPGSGGAVGSFSGNLSSGTTTGGNSVSSVVSRAGGNGSDGAAVGENQSGSGGRGGYSGVVSGHSGSFAGGTGGSNNTKGSDGNIGGGGGGGHSQSTANPAGGTSSDGDHPAVGASTHGGTGGRGQIYYKFVRVI